MSNLYGNLGIVFFTFALTTGCFGQIDKNGLPFPNADTSASSSMSARFGNTPTEKVKRAQKLEIETLNGERERLAAPQAYQEKFSVLLQNKKVNLARLYPNFHCHDQKVVSVNTTKQCLNALPMIGDGAFYSFRLKTNLNQITDADGIINKVDWADIQFENGKLTVGSAAIQGLIAELDSDDFSAITPDSADVKLLEKYKPKSKIEDFQIQKALLKNGIWIEDRNYSDSILAESGKMYLLRSIAYQRFLPMLQLQTKNQQFPQKVYFDDLRIDIIVAFKIVGQEKDGSIVILWKELKRKIAPPLVR